MVTTRRRSAVAALRALVPIARAAKSSAGAARMGFCRFRCKSCEAHLQYADQDADGAFSASRRNAGSITSRAMIEGNVDLAKTAALCVMHPTTAFRWRHRFLRAPASDKPRGLRGIVEADETFVFSIIPSRADLVRPARRKARRRGFRNGLGILGLHQDNIPILVARDRNGATFDAILAQVDGASVSLRPRRNCHAGQSSHRRWRQGDRHFRPSSRDCLPHRAVAGKPSSAAPHLHINNVNAYHGRLKQWLNRFQRRRHQEPAQLSRLAARSSKPGATNSNRQAGSKALYRNYWPYQQINAIRA